MLWTSLLILAARFLHAHPEESTSCAIFDVKRVCPDCCYGRPLKTHINIMSGVSCSGLCSRESTCVSWQYVPGKSTCRTNEERLTTVSTSCHSLVRYGEIEKVTCLPPPIFQPCNRPADCNKTRFTCRRGRCECRDGYPYDHKTDSCPHDCEQYGDTLREVFYQILTHVHGIIDTSVAQCHRYCTSHKDCRYVKHYAVTGLCTRTNYTAKSTSNVRYSANPGWTFWERDCV